MREYLNDGWIFYEENSQNGVEVRIPHTVKELPYHYFDESEYQMLSRYEKILDLKDEYKGKRLILTFDGIAHYSEVYINNQKVSEHKCGYTAQTIDITDYVKYGEENKITVNVDSRETLNVPPFGYVIDYMTYGGIYRDVYLEVKNQQYIEDVFVYTRENSEVVTDIKIFGNQEGLTTKKSIRKYKDNRDFEELSPDNIVTNPDIWDIVSPNLYELKIELLNDKNEILDEKIVRFGFRTAEFKADGFYLNGRKLKIRGLNRHQSFAYVGYAMPKSMQVLDADILKNELGLNAVRTSHYPQSHYFLDRCDEIGLLVFTEIPGWQHIGDEEWKKQAVVNTEDMVKQYRNHTSIILWGVRINESVDDDDFYRRTNEAARKLDPTRQTGGVRCYKNSNLLEDVYTYNDFVHDGKAPGCEPKKNVTSDINKPYLITEYNGHMFPCKTFDWEDKRCEHAMRHVRVLDAVKSHEDIAGSFGWCMFDYNTHKDFGSGDRICYHGVMDMFRNPKLASAVYASQQEETPVLEISSTMDIGEHPGCIRGDIFIFTNADSVKMYKNDILIKEYTNKDSEFKNIAHGPIRVDDYVGDQLIKHEGMSKKQSDEVKNLLNQAAILGMNNLSKNTMFKAGITAMKYKMKFEDAVKLYDKYVGNWGRESTVYKFEAIKNNAIVLTKEIKPMTEIKISAKADHTVLEEINTYDVAAIRIEAVDDTNSRLPFYNDPIKLKVEGPIELIGPDIISLNGGTGGAYVKTTGIKGMAKLIIEAINGKKEEIVFEVR